MKDMIRVVVLVKDKEPIVVEIEKGIDSYKEVLANHLTQEELAKSPINGLDFFSPDVENIGGVVEEYSACHPYPRNREWHGPALLTQIGSEGQTVSIDNEHLHKILDRYSLANSILKSKSDKINNFIEKNMPEPEIYNVEHGNHFGTLNTHDTIDMILRETSLKSIDDIEAAFEDMELMASVHNLDIKKVFNDYLKDVGKHVFIQMAGANDPFMLK